MTATTAAHDFSAGQPGHRITATARDGLAVAWRNLIALRRVPRLLVFSTIQPLVFVLMFRYVFGGVVGPSLPHGVSYVDFLLPGIFVQTAVFGSMNTAIGLATDMQTGLMERFRSLPMARSAVLAGLSFIKPDTLGHSQPGLKSLSCIAVLDSEAEFAVQACPERRRIRNA